MKRAITALGIAFVCYCLLGFLLIPAIAERAINQQLARYAKVPAFLERVEFNPFSLELTLHALRLGEPDAPQLAFRRLYLNLQLDSLWRRALHLRDLELDGLHSEVLFAKDGQLNLSQLFELPASSEPSAEEEPQQPFPLLLDRLQLSHGSLHFQDRRPSEPIELVYDSLDFELRNLTTLPDGDADMTLVASAPDGGRIDWQGQISLMPIRSSGQLKITGAQMSAWWPYVRDAVPLVLKKGQLDLHTDYRLDLSESTQLQLSNAALSIGPFAIEAPDGRPLLDLQRLEVSQTTLDLAKRQVVIGQLRSENLEAWAAREANGELDWQALFSTQPAAAPAAPVPEQTPTPTPTDQVSAAPAEPQLADKPWQVLLSDAQLRGYRIHLADRVPKQEVELLLGPLDLDLRDVDSLGKSPFRLKLASGIGKQGHLGIEGQVNLKPLTAQLQVTSEDLDLRLAQAYLQPFVRLELRSGLLASALKVDLTNIEPLAFSVDGRAEISQLHTLDTLKQRDFVKWPRLTLDGLAYRHEQSLAIAKISVQQPYVRFLINEDRTTNVSELIIAQPADSAPAPAATGQTKEPLAIHIGAIEILDGSGHFADFSLTPPFATGIQELNGSIGTLDSRSKQQAKVNVQGKVDRYAPVSIVGSLTPFDPLEKLDIVTRFKRVELTTLTPYSGKFAGYRIRKGRLDLDLHYRIQQGQLNAENKVVVEQLQLGERVDSPDAVDLPVRLAVALLKDSHGRITIELPVKGDLNDPQFSVMPIVWQTLRNLIVRAAQAPFKFIAGLAGGSHSDLSQVSFAAGSSDLQPSATQALDTLASALKQRPELRLEVEGASAPASDGPLLAEQRLEREYQSTYYRVLQRRGDKVPAKAEQLPVPKDEKSVLLEGIYRSRLEQQPPAEWTELDKPQRSARLRQALIDHWAQDASLARRLAQTRASAIKGYLVEQGGLSDEQIYLLDVTLLEGEAQPSVLTPLHLNAE